ncbi:MAG: hypothetical protein MUF78_11550, partial [Candidatus Edwardsbacteria bacterium]|nr:hypothetical protein [Candidatus Edwardsbacteria bacterium]
MKTIHWLLVATLLSAGVHAEAMGRKKQAAAETVKASQSAATMPEAVNRLGFELFRDLTAAAPSGNTFISPYSVHTALTMAWAGARGQTADEMASVMRLPPAGAVRGAAALGRALSSADSMARFDIANSMWLRRGLPIRKEYQALVERDFGGRAAELDFGDPAALKTINGWVKEKTNGMIDR